MVRLVAQFFIKEGSFDEAFAVLKELVAETRKEAGCITYEVYQDTADTNHLFLMEAWESQEILDIHSKSAHFTALVPQIGALSSKPAVVTKTTFLV